MGSGERNGRRHDNLRQRTKQFALRVVRMYGRLPTSEEARAIGKQLLRSGTSVAANYREASRARSDSELRSKLGIVEQELDETLMWLELLVEGEIVAADRLQDLMTETDELLRITVASIKTLKSRNKI